MTKREIDWLLDGTYEEARFLLDADADLQRLLTFLQGAGYRVIPLPIVLRSLGDEAIREEALRQDRILITHDNDFLDFTRHRLEESPGIVIIPGGSGDVENYFDVIDRALRLIKKHRPVWTNTCMVVSPRGVVTSYHLDDAQIATQKMRPLDDGWEVWLDDEAQSH